MNPRLSAAHCQMITIIHVLARGEFSFARSKKNRHHLAFYSDQNGAGGNVTARAAMAANSMDRIDRRDGAERLGHVEGLDC